MEVAGKSDGSNALRAEPQRGRGRVVIPFRDGAVSDIAEQQRLLAQIEQDVVAIRRARVGTAELADKILYIFQRLLDLHGIQRMDVTGIKLLFQALSGHLVMQRAAIELYDMANRAILEDVANESEGLFREGILEPVGVSRALSHIVRFYRDRLATLQLIDAQGVEPVAPIRDLHGFADAMHQGLYGVEGVFRVIVRDTARLPAWCRLSLFHPDGSPVRARPQWQSWCDEFSVGSSDGQAVATVAPLSSSHASAIFDRLSLFIPYEACDLHSGIRQIELRCALLADDGSKLCEERQPLKVVVPALAQSAPALMSPQSLGLWPEDFGSGDRICNLSVERTFSVSMPDLEVVRVEADVHLCGHAGEQLSLECRLMTADGSLIRRKGALENSDDAALFARAKLYPQLTLSDFPRTALEVPVHACDLPAGKHVVTVEVSMVGEKERVLCGLTRTVSIVVPEYTADLPSTQRPEERAVVEPSIGVHLLAFDVDGSARFGKSRMIRAIARFRSSDWHGRAFRALVNLEDMKGEALLDTRRGAPLAKAVCFSGAAQDKGSREVVLGFTAAEVPPREGEQIVAHLKLFSLDGRLLLEASAALPGLPSSEVVTEPEKVPAEDHPLLLSDVLLQGIEETGSVRCRVYLDINLESYESDRFTIYYEGLDGLGRAIPLPVSGANQDLPGTILNFDLAQLVPGARARVGWFQMFVDLLCAPRAHGAHGADRGQGRLAALRIFLFAGSGKLLQSVTHELWPGKAFATALLPWTETQDIETAAQEPGIFEGLGRFFRGKK
ncbi:MAG: hypothetical protein QY326_01095 [Bdellovibrionota bacterium]|nr:MAG: hypothetical protein QY326_01095 [Bdellovibrionota bacterium]